MKAKTFFLQLVPDFFPTASFTPLAPICFSSTHSRNSEPPLALVCVPLNDTEVDEKRVQPVPACPRTSTRPLSLINRIDSLFSWWWRRQTHTHTNLKLPPPPLRKLGCVCVRQTAQFFPQRYQCVGTSSLRSRLTAWHNKIDLFVCQYKLINDH